MQIFRSAAVMLSFYCTQTHMKLQSEFSREFLKTIFARLPPFIASAARCGPHPRTPLATPLCLPPFHFITGVREYNRWEFFLEFNDACI